MSACSSTPHHEATVSFEMLDCFDDRGGFKIRENDDGKRAERGLEALGCHGV